MLLPIDHARLFLLPLPDDARRRLAVGWLLLDFWRCSVPAFSRAAGWLYARCSHRFRGRIFHTALVVPSTCRYWWFLAIGGMLWSLNSTLRAPPSAGRRSRWRRRHAGHDAGAIPGRRRCTHEITSRCCNIRCFSAGCWRLPGCALLVLRAMSDSAGWMWGGRVRCAGLNAAAVSAALAHRLRLVNR
jgi:hypothetical protein